MALIPQTQELNKSKCGWWSWKESKWFATHGWSAADREKWGI